MVTNGPGAPVTGDQWRPPSAVASIRPFARVSADPAAAVVASPAMLVARIPLTAGDQVAPASVERRRSPTGSTSLNTVCGCAGSAVNEQTIPGCDDQLRPPSALVESVHRPPVVTA